MGERPSASSADAANLRGGRSQRVHRNNNSQSVEQSISISALSHRSILSQLLRMTTFPPVQVRQQ